MKRSAPCLATSANSSAGMKNQPRLLSGVAPLASALPVMVRKLLSFSTKRVLLDTIAQLGVHVGVLGQVPREVGPEAQLLERVGPDLGLGHRSEEVADRVLLELRQAEDAVLALVAGREVVGADVAPAGDVDAVLLAEAGLERAGGLVLERRVHVDRGLGAEAVELELEDAEAVEVGIGVVAAVVVEGIGVVVAHPAHLAEQVPARAARGAVLGRDADHPVRGLDAVERGGRRPLHDLDVVDVVGVEVVDARGALVAGVAHAEAADVERARDRRALGADAVDVVQRLVGERHAVGAADPDAGAGAGGAAALEHLDARRAARDQVGELGDRRELGHGVDVDGRDGVGDLELALLAGGGAHDLVELHRRRLEREVERGVLARAHGRGLDQRPVADAQHPDLVGPGRPRHGSGTRRPGSRSRSGRCRS